MRILKNSKKNLKEILSALKKGLVLVLPTDTVYGLVCNATNKIAVEKIFKIKKRSRLKPFLLFVKDIKMAKKLAFIDKEQERILKKYWPGKYTFILKSKAGSQRFKIYGVNKSTIGLRIPQYRFLNNLLKKINKPLVQTSANISNCSATTKIKNVIRYFENQKIQPDIIVDAGDLKKSRPSTIIDLTSQKIKVLRK